MSSQGIREENPGLITGTAQNSRTHLPVMVTVDFDDRSLGSQRKSERQC